MHIVALGSEVIKKSRKREKRNLGKAISSYILHLPDYYPPPWKCSYSATGNQTAHTKALEDIMKRTRERDRRRAQHTAHTAWYHTTNGAIKASPPPAIGLEKQRIEKYVNDAATTTTVERRASRREIGSKGAVSLFLSLCACVLCVLCTTLCSCNYY
jgi:hypothetical protein